MKFLILYFSHTGHTKSAAEAVLEGIKSAGGEGILTTTKEFKPETLNDYDGLLVGSPCWQKHWGDGPPTVEEPTLGSLAKIPEGVLKNKIVGGFVVTHETKGHLTLQAIEKAVIAKGVKNFKKGPVACAGSKMSDWKGPDLLEKDLERYKAFGASLI